MAKKGELVYNSETGDVEEQGMEQVAFEPLHVPCVLENFMGEFIPAENEQSATDVVSIGRLREMLSCWVPFGAKIDPLAEYLEELANHGYIMSPTSSGPAMCLTRRDSPKVIRVYDEAEEINE